jgi:hypothetical protein
MRDTYWRVIRGEYVSGNLACAAAFGELMSNT